MLGELQRVCDYLVVVTAAEVRIAGAIDTLIGQHHIFSDAHRQDLPDGVELVAELDDDGERRLLTRANRESDPAWGASPPDLDDLVVGYLTPRAPVEIVQ